MRRRRLRCGVAMTASSTRRETLVGALGLCCVPAVGRAAATARLDEVGPGVFVRRGAHAEATAGNRNGIANSGFIIGTDAVLVTDPGGSLADGAWLRDEIRARTTRPIRHVVLNHAHPDHVFGAAAFVADRPAFVGHHALRAALEARGQYYQSRLAAAIGSEAGEVVYPTMAVRGEAVVDVGGRSLRLTAHDTAHSHGDLSLLDGRSGILFAADLLFVERVPALDGSLIGWLREIERLEAMGATRAVPGHGPAIVEFAAAMRAQKRYLTILRDETRTAIAAGVPIEAAVRTVARSERDRWLLFNGYNGRNVTQAYKELEWE